MQLIPWWHDLGSFRVPATSSSKFWCKHIPPNFGIKVILFQNYHICIPDWSTVTGRELWSRVHYLSLLASTHEPMPQNFLQERRCFTGTWIHLPKLAIKGLSDLGESSSTIQPCFSSICFLECSWLRWTLHGLSFCYEDLERLVEQEDQLLRLKEFLWYNLSLLSMLVELF